MEEYNVYLRCVREPKVREENRVANWAPTTPRKTKNNVECAQDRHIGDKRFKAVVFPTGRVPPAIPVFANVDVCCQINLKLLSMRLSTSQAAIHS